MNRPLGGHVADGAPLEHELAVSARLVCPETKLSLRGCSFATAEQLAGSSLMPRNSPAHPQPIGPTETVLLREDYACAYPMLDDIPVLLAPEMLTVAPRREFDLSAPLYAEAYDEMSHYSAEADAKRLALVRGETDRLAEASAEFATLQKVAALRPAQRHGFPDPWELWINAPDDAEAQKDVYRHLSPLGGKSILQVGGAGGTAVTFLLAGAAHATVVSPVAGELWYALELARRFDVVDSVCCVVGIGEQLPFRDASFDLVYAGGTLHHMRTDVALPESARVLKSGGRFAAIEPWEAPGYRLGTRLLGKREANVYCKPLTAARVAPLFDAFQKATVIHHGALTRYAMIASAKAGLRFSVKSASRITCLDDALSSRISRLRAAGSSVAVLGEVESHGSVGGS